MIIDKFLKVRGPLTIHPEPMGKLARSIYQLELDKYQPVHLHEAEHIMINTGFSTGLDAYKKADNVIKKRRLGEEVVLDFGEAISPFPNTVFVYDDLLAVWVVRYNVVNRDDLFLYALSIIDKKVLKPPEPDNGNENIMFFVFLQNKKDYKIDLNTFKPLLPPALANLPGYEELYIIETISKLHMAMESAAIMNCKNIVLEREHPPKKRRKKVAKNKKRLPLLSYYVITIDPNKIRTKSKVEQGKRLGKNRLHLCRGHIRHYTKEKPLFGKVSGSIWIESHARGGKEKGTITKSYELKQ